MDKTMKNKSEMKRKFTSQPFGAGFMVWIKVDNQVYSFNNKTEF